MDQLEIECVTFDFHSLIKEVANLLSVQIAFRGLHYTCNIDEQVPVEIYSDQNRILQVMLNLLENAIKYNKNGGSISVNVESVLYQNKEAIEVSVSDTGKGIDLSKLANIFSLEDTGSENTDLKRISVSLPIAYQICKKLGGDLTVKSVIGQGSTFKFIIVQPNDKPRASNCSENTEEWKEGDICEEFPDIQKPLLSKSKHIMQGLFPTNIKEGVAKRKYMDRNSNYFNFLTWSDSDPTHFKKGHGLQKTSLCKRLTDKLVKEILKSNETRKRSFSQDDIKADKLGGKFKHTILLKKSIQDIQNCGAFLRQTIRKDIATIRGNVIRSKKDIFAPIWESPLRVNTFKEVADIKELTKTKVKNVRNELLNFHLDNDLFKLMPGHSPQKEILHSVKVEEKREFQKEDENKTKGIRRMLCNYTLL